MKKTRVVVLLSFTERSGCYLRRRKNLIFAEIDYFFFFWGRSEFSDFYRGRIITLTFTKRIGTSILSKEYDSLLSLIRKLGILQLLVYVRNRYQDLPNDKYKLLVYTKSWGYY